MTMIKLSCVKHSRLPFMHFIERQVTVMITNADRSSKQHNIIARLPYTAKLSRLESKIIVHGKTFAVAASLNNECLWLVNYSS